MRWIARLLRRRPKPTPQTADQAAPTPGQREAESALIRAQAARQAIESYWPEVTHRSRRFKSERKQNHFAEMFRSALEGGRH